MFFYTDFFLIDHFDCMIKMFCLKDQKIPWLLSLLLLSLVLLFFRCGDLCCFFFSHSVISLSLSFAYIEILINIENREKQNITP